MSSGKVISKDGPSVVEKAQNLLLEAWVKSCLEPVDESDRRRRAVEQLNLTCKQWIRYVLVTECGLPASEDYGGRIFTTGSFRHNVHSSGSDIDVVLIAPTRVTRQHFFSSLVERLQDLRGVTDLTCAEEAIVPLISFKFEGVDIDLALVAIRSENVPDNINMLDDRVHIGLDEFAVRSVNGVRDAELLINSVPNTLVFRQALRFVKHWAKRRGIYGAKLGFTSGIGFAIMVARVCQCYPNLNSAGLVCRFFRFYRNWFVPNPTAARPNNPIFITDSLTPETVIPGVPRSWNARTHAGDAQAVYPIITPAYPYQNSCYSVSRTTLATICEELDIAHETIQKHLEAEAHDAPAIAKAQHAKLEESGRSDVGGLGVANLKAGTVSDNIPEYAKEEYPFGVWSRVLESYNPFASASYFLHVAVSATAWQDYDRWVDFVEAKLRYLWTEASFNRGCAFECYPQVKIRVVTRRYEEPSQAEALSRLKAAAKAAAARRAAIGGSGSMQHASGATGANVDLGALSPLGAPNPAASPDPRGSVNALAPPGSPGPRNSTAVLTAAGAPGSAIKSPSQKPQLAPSAQQQPQQQPAAPTTFTCHFYFPLKMDNTMKDGKGQPLKAPDLPAIVRAWYTVVRSNKEMTTNTVLPTVSVVRVKDLPSWLPGVPKEEEAAVAPKAADAAQPEAAPATDPVKRTLDMTSGASPQRAAPPQPAPGGPQQQAPAAAVKPPVATPAPPVAANSTAAEADELLGLDF